LVDIQLLNSAKDGTPLSPAGDVFLASQVRFITWEVLFRNRKRGTTPISYRVNATYFTPTGKRLGVVEDTQDISNESRALFTGRVGNSNGGAFAPGMYRVEFTLNGKSLSSRRFTVQRDGSGQPQTPRENVAARDQPDGNLASLLRHHSGSLLGLVPGREVSVEIDFRPQPNGNLKGDLTIHEPGYGVVMIEGRTERNEVEFRGSIGRETYHFRGWRDEDRLSGSYRISPSGKEGRWSVRLGRTPSS
jgi:hypothetical protein